MTKTRKILNLIALVVFLCQNFMTPFSYVFADEVSEVEVTQNDDSTSSRAEGNEGEGSSNNSETPMDSSSQAPQNDEGDAQNDEGGENNPSVTDVTAPLESGAQDENTQENEGISDEISDEIEEIISKVKYFFKRVGNYQYIKYSEDENEIGIITLTDPDNGNSITIMDRNLGSENAGTSQNSYGYYFQWGNNHGVEEVNSENKTTTKVEYDDSYSEKGYDGDGLFFAGDTDYWKDGKHYDNLWGNDDQEISRQAACPAGYHIPTIKEWNELISIWGKIHTQDVSVNEEGDSISLSRYTANKNQTDIVSFKDSAQECGESDTECVKEDDFGDIIEILSSELKLPLAGGYSQNGKFYDGKGIYWTATSKDGDKAGVFNMNAYFAENGDEEERYRAQGHNIRCFQNVEESSQNDEGNIVPLGERGDGEAEGIFSDGEEKILSPQQAEQASDSSFTKEQREEETPMDSQQVTQQDGAEGTSAEAQNEEKKDLDIGDSILEDMPTREKSFDAMLLGFQNPQEIGIKSSAGVLSGSCGDNIEWTFDPEVGTLTISGNGNMNNYSPYNMPWYNYRSDINSVIIGDGVTSIGDYAFRGCSSLTSIEIPDSVTSIGDYAFQSCSSLTSIEIPDSVTSIGNYAFQSCSKLTSIEIPDSVTSIGDRAFQYCSSLTSIEIPNSVTSIGNSAFYGCSSLTSIEIPDSVTSIENYAFYGCSSLTSIEIPDSVTSIGDRAFQSCSSLTSIEIPDSVTSIGSRAFSDCSSLTSIEIPDSVTSIGDYAFEGCSSLTSIEIPDSVTSIGDYAFEGCSSLTSIEVAENNVNYSSEDGVLFNKNKTILIQYPNKNGAYTIPDSVTSIEDFAFYGCTGLTSIEIPDSVTSIGSRAFYHCSSLTSIEIPDSVTSIGIGTFSHCSSLTSIEIPDSVTSIENYAFYGCSLTSIEIPDSVTSIENYAFCGSDEYITGYVSEINEYLTSISENACLNLVESNIFLMTFEPNNGKSATTQHVAEGQTATEPLAPKNDGYSFAGWYTSTDSGQTLSDTAFDFTGTTITGDITLYAKWNLNTTTTNRIELSVTATAGQTLTISKYFANDYAVDWGDGSAVQEIDSDKTHTYESAGTYIVKLLLPEGTSRWNFRTGLRSYGLVPVSGTTMTGVKITYMPSLADGFGDNATSPGDHFFQALNYKGAITGLPEGSFDTSRITAVGDGFFYGFNEQGLLIDLPDGSFNISHITSVGDYFFDAFNSNGQLTGLPEGSFDLSNITTAGDSFFTSFNSHGKLTNLPDQSFNVSHITTAGDDFFNSFNRLGLLTSLPTGSFIFSTGLTTVGSSFFNGFNSEGLIENLPDGSFDTSHITTVGNKFFRYFSDESKLTSLPEGSFDLSNIITAGDSFFYGFNYSGKITNLPDSFKLSSAAYDKEGAYQNAFNSPNYTLNRNVSDLVEGITPPSSDMNVFSDNQPGRCGVDANWLVSTENLCSTVYITYNPYNGAFPGQAINATILATYNADSSGKYVSDINIQFPNRVGYMFDGWYTDTNYTTEWTGYVDDSTAVTEVFAKWLKFEDLNFNFNGSKFTIMDRNLGATGNTLSSYGKYYQWGNNYGFVGGENGEPVSVSQTDVLMPNISSTPRGPGNYYSNATYIIRTVVPYRWEQENNANLWGDVTDTKEARQGPCPLGYHIPTNTEWEELLTAWCSANAEDCAAENKGTKFRETFNLPLGGRRRRQTSMVNHRDTDGLYRSSSYIDSASGFAYSLYFASNFIQTDKEYSRANADLIRCIKNDANKLIIFESNGGNDIDEQWTESGTVISEPSAPTKSGYNFAGWYKESGLINKWNFSTDTVTGDITLYAKWIERDVDYVITIHNNNVELSEELSDFLDAVYGDYYQEWTQEHIEVMKRYTAVELGINSWFKDGKIIEGETLDDGFSFRSAQGKELLSIHYTLSGDDMNTFDVITAANVTSGDNIESPIDEEAMQQISRNYEDILRVRSIQLKFNMLQTVTFDSGSGSVVPVQILEPGSTATRPADPTFAGHSFQYWHLSGVDEAFDFDTPITGDITLYAKWNLNTTTTNRIELSVTATAGQTLTIGKYFANDYAVDWGDESTVQEIDSDKTHTYESAGTYTVKLLLPEGTSRWTFAQSPELFDSLHPLVPQEGTTVTNVAITMMPSLAEGFGNSASVPGDMFFALFNMNGAIESLPAGSFDTSNITTAGDMFFGAFNRNGLLVSLPAGSFKTENIATAGDGFFYAFNTQEEEKRGGGLKSLPEGSFKFSPLLTTLGAGSFIQFNYGGGIESLPAGSFDTSHIRTAGTYTFAYFNYLGSIENLPEGSFDTSNITTVGEGFFLGFNAAGALTSLPEGSFNLSNITTAGEEFFAYFNMEGALESLPEGSFNLSNITTAGDYFFDSFNEDGAIESLPDSFSISSVGAAVAEGYDNAFNSPEHTLNRKVSDLVAGISNLSEDRDVFSDNQPGRCGVHENWLVSTSNQCDTTYYTVTFNSNSGSAVYAQTVTGGSTITEPSAPSRSGYSFAGWYKESGLINKWDFSTDTVIGDITLYARWVQCPEREEYVESKDKCIPSRAIIRDSVSGEIIQINDMEWDDLELYFLQSDGTTVKHFTIMDRNLGATEVYNQQFVQDATKINTASFGYHYQRGNNYGFEPCINNPLTNNSCDTFPKSETTVGTIPQNIWSAYMPSKYARNTWSTSANWMTGNIEDLKTANIWGGGGDTISSNHDNTLIGNNNDWSILSGRQGPCPEGYYIPSTYDWSILKNAWGGSVASASNGTQFASDLLLPPAGRRSYGKNVIFQGSYGYYWSSSSPSPYYDSAHILRFFSPYINPRSSDNRSEGNSVRCAKSSPNTSTFTLHANGGSKTVIAFTGTVGNGKFTALGTPTRGSDEFDGWYTANVGGDKLGVGSGVVQNIYARWLCADGYVDDGTTCVDAQAPNITIATQPSTTCATTKSVSATITDNVGVSSKQYAVVDSSTCGSSIDSTATWNPYNGGDITLDSENYNDKYICFRASDAEGNTSYLATNQIINIDTQWPGVPSLTSPMPDAYTGDDMPTFSWTAGSIAGCSSLANYEIQICRDNACTEVVESGTTTTATFTPDTSLSDGEYYWRVRAKDDLNRYSDYTTSSQFTVDTTAPAITFDKESGSVAKSHSVQITATDTLSKLVHGGAGSAQPSGGDERNTATYSSSSEGYTVTYNGKSYTLASSDQSGTYRRGNNIAGDTTTYNGAGNNNRWGGGDDSASNGYDSGNPRSERQGPCDNGYHVPSRGEWTAIMTAWCHLDTNECTSSDISAGYISNSNSTLASKFKSDFAMTDGLYWSSSPLADYAARTWGLYVSNDSIDPSGYDLRSEFIRVRCLKNDTSAGGSSAGSLKYRWQASSDCSSDESDYTSTSRDTYSDGDTTATATVTTEGLSDGSYYLCVLSGSAVDNAGNTNITTKTSGVFVVDNTAPVITINNPDTTPAQSKTITASANEGTLYMAITGANVCDDSLDFVAYDEITFSSESDNGKYVCYKAVDSVGNVKYEISAPISGIDKSGPSISFDNYVAVGPTKSDFVEVNWGDATVKKWMYSNASTCSNNQSDYNNSYSDSMNQTTEANNGKYICLYAEDSAGNVSTLASEYPINIDTTAPTCEITGNPENWINQNVTLTVTMYDTNVDNNGYKWNTSDEYSSTTTKQVTENGTYTAYVRDLAGNEGSCSVEVTNIDKTVPVASITSTNDLKSASQTATLSCTDDKGIASYYRGPKSNPENSDFVAGTPTTKTVNDSGTYYLFCKDTAGNTSNSDSQTYYTYTVYNMLNAVDKSEGTYNSTNYPQTGSTATYLAPAGTTITFANVYAIPTYSATDQYVGYTTADSGTPSEDSNITLNNNSEYYFWFNRAKYILTLTKGTGIKTIYYQVNGANYANTTTSTTVDMKAGSDAYAYALADNGYTYIATDSSNPWRELNIQGEKIFSPEATIDTYSIKYHLNGGTQVEPRTTYTVETDTFTLVYPTRDNYIFAGWTGSNGDELETTVTIIKGTKYEDLEYYANWYEDFNHDGQNDATEPRYEVRINYVYSRGGEAAESYITGGQLSGFTYDVTSPSIENYEADKTEVSGTITGNVEVTVTYSPIHDDNNNEIADEEEDRYEVRINYVYSRGGEAAPSVSEMYLSGIIFNFVSPNIPNYTPNSGIVSGKGIEAEQTFTVKYTPNHDENRDGYADEEQEHYNLTIHYVNGSGGKVYNDYSGNYVSGANYSIISPLKMYYTIQTGGEVISGIMGTGNIEKTVVYLANNDTNRNGIADEEEVKPNPSGGGSGGGGGGGGNKNPITDKSDDKLPTSGTIAENTTIENDKSNDLPNKSREGQHSTVIYEGATEMEQAYNFAYKNGITTMTSLKKAKMNMSLTRIQMAKMLSKYAMNVLGKKPDETKFKKFKDVTDKLDSQYGYGVTFAYQLGIMGQNMSGNNFRPNDEVTRAEFVTALSRLLYNTSDGEYKSTSKYYIHHMEKLKERGIITKFDPKMKEKRGYVMIMLMRSVL